MLKEHNKNIKLKISRILIVILFEFLGRNHHGFVSKYTLKIGIYGFSDEAMIANRQKKSYRSIVP